MRQLDRTLALQKVPGAATRLALVKKHLVVNNNLYIVSEQCNESLRQRMQRSILSHGQITRVEEFLDPLEALNAQTAPEKRTTFIVLLIVHDCLRILKFLAAHRPYDAVCFHTDNLMLQDGHVRLADGYLSKNKLKREMIRARTKLPESSLEPFIPETYQKRLWQIQNLQFVTKIACQLLCSARDQDEPKKLLANQRVRQSPLYWLLNEIYKSTNEPFSLSEERIYPFICQCKIKVKTLLALDPVQSYKSLIQLQEYAQRIDNEYDVS